MTKQIQIAIIVAIVLGIGIIGLRQFNQPDKKIATSKEQVRKSPDVKKSDSATQEPVAIEKTESTTGNSSKMDNSEWKIYKSMTYEFTFRYPEKFVISNNSSSENIIITNNEGGHWVYSVKVLSNDKTLSLDKIDEIKKFLKIDGDAIDIFVNHKSAKKFINSKTSDYGNVNVIIFYKNSIIQIAGDDSHNNKQDFDSFLDSFEFTN